jgi:spoIIIJ-associated protein
MATESGAIESGAVESGAVESGAISGAIESAAMHQRAVVEGKDWLETLLRLAGFPAEVQAEVAEPLRHQPIDTSDGQPHHAAVWLTIAPDALTADQQAKLIGDRGEVIDAIQYLASLQLNQRLPEEHIPFVVDLDGYRDRRLAELTAIVDQAVAAVRASGEPYELKSLSSAERRQVHNLLEAEADLETFSQGREPDRRLVVRRKAEETS